MLLLSVPGLGRRRAGQGGLEDAAVLHAKH